MSNLNNLPLAYAVSRLRHPEHPGFTRREYLSYRRWARRRLIWQCLAAAVLVIAATWWGVA